MSTISTHVLDTSLGKPAAGVPVLLAARQSDGSWKTLAQGATDSDGRWRPSLKDDSSIGIGTCKLSFDAATYFQTRNTECFFTSIEISFTIRDAAQNYHIPLLLSPYSYSTYRGS